MLPLNVGLPAVDAFASIFVSADSFAGRMLGAWLAYRFAGLMFGAWLGHSLMVGVIANLAVGEMKGT